MEDKAIKKVINRIKKAESGIFPVFGRRRATEEMVRDFGKENLIAHIHLLKNQFQSERTLRAFDDLKEEVVSCPDL